MSLRVHRLRAAWVTMLLASSGTVAWLACGRLPATGPDQSVIVAEPSVPPVAGTFSSLAMSAAAVPSLQAADSTQPLQGSEAAVQIPAPASPGPVHFDGGDGSSMATAVVIVGAPNEQVGVDAEYDWLARKLGRRGVDWTLGSQGLRNIKGRAYDVITVTVRGKKRNIYFDISDFFGKF